MFTNNQSLLLAILAENPRKEYFLQELGRLIGKKPGVFQRGLNSLEKQGWVVSRRQGPLRLFKINDAHPLHKEIRAIARKTMGVEAELKRIVNGIDTIKTALIYGSYAKDHMRADSDIDLLAVVTDAKAQDRLVKELAGVEKSLGREVNYKLYDDKDFKQRLRKKDPFLTEALSDKRIILKGEV